MATQNSKTKSNTNSDSKKTTTNTSNTQKSSSSSSRTTIWGLNKISFYTICAVAILYLVAAILGACKIGSKAVSALQGIATAMLIIIASILGWRYVAKKQTVWKVLFVVCLLVVVLGIILPLISF